ncbi:hypothetical protein [Sutcliffiella rhizosphaerae]|uniref:hypothetical protein n=1 Tax=Sutcliffiella rhizosphaerae TaxID=2880967 RepID=UPI001E591A60|nr:hypothetical protein [Sutcliffiella rhizosphaerae]
MAVFANFVAFTNFLDTWNKRYRRTLFSNLGKVSGKVFTEQSQKPTFYGYQQQSLRKELFEIGNIIG